MTCCFHKLAITSLIILVTLVLQLSVTLAQPLETETPVPGWLGVEIQNLTQEETTALGGAVGWGVKVVHLAEDSPATTLLPDDILIELNGERIVSVKSLKAVIHGKGVGETVKLRLLRKDGLHEISVILTAPPLSQLLYEITETQIPEQKIPLLKAALKIESQIQSWTLELPRKKLRGMLLGELGGAYVQQKQGDPAENAEQAIAAYEAALTVYTHEAFPEYRAAIQDALGVTLWRRIRGNPADNIERAIAAYQAALTVFTPEAFPEQWADTQHHIGIAYQVRLEGDPAKNRALAIVAYENALTIFTQKKFPRQWATVQNSLGAAYAQRISNEHDFIDEHADFRRWDLSAIFERSKNLERSIVALKASLSVITREAFPEKWAATQSNLANVYTERMQDNHADNLEIAIDLYKSTLIVYTNEKFPLDWARIKQAIGHSYSKRIHGQHRNNVEKAIAAYEDSLTVYTLEKFPLEHMKTERALGLAFMEKHEWNQASTAFAHSREAFLLLFGEASNDVEARKIIFLAGSMFNYAAYSAAMQNNIEDALQLFDDGKAIMLNTVRDLNNIEISADDQNYINNLYINIKKSSLAYQLASGEERIQKLAILHEFRRKLLEFTRKMNTRSGGNAKIGILARAASIIPEGGALVAPILTNFGGQLLIITLVQGKAKLKVVEIDKSKLDMITTKYFDGLEGQSENDPSTNDQVSFKAHINYTTPVLWKNIGDPLSKALAEEGVKLGGRLIILPHGASGLLPFGLAQNPTNGQRLAENYEISYAPSIEALQGPSRIRSSPSLAAIVDPQGKLPFSVMEGALAASHFGEGKKVTLSNKKATRSAVLTALEGKEYWHFSAHGKFSWDDGRSSALLMADGDPLTVGMLFDAHGLGRPRLVVLSACETGLYDITHTPDEFMGLPSAFLALGAEGVLSTLWKVDDRATALLIAKFYDLHLDEGFSPPKALKEAQEWLANASEEVLISYAENAVVQGRINKDWPQRLKKSFEHTKMNCDSKAQHVSETDSVSGSNSEQPLSDPYSWGGSLNPIIVGPNGIESPASQEGIDEDGAPKLKRDFDHTQLDCEAQHATKRSSVIKDDSDLPFSNPYFWGGVIFTGR